MSLNMRTRWIAGFVLLFAALTVWAQQEEGRNPYTSAEDVAAGADLFRMRCALCHGADGSGGRGPDLRRGQFRHGGSDAGLFRSIRFGISDSGMPRLGGGMSEERIWQVVAYVRSLSRSAREIDVPGNPVQGEQLYLGKGDCSRCHTINGVGGRLGPNLSEIGWLRSTKHLKSSIINPDEDIDRRYLSLHILKKGGQRVQGVPLNEDSYSIQLMDLQENLHSLWKRDLEEVRQEERSWMPSYQGTFSESELDDLVSYLYSLRGRTDEP